MCGVRVRCSCHGKFVSRSAGGRQNITPAQVSRRDLDGGRADLGAIGATIGQRILNRHPRGLEARQRYLDGVTFLFVQDDNMRILEIPRQLLDDLLGTMEAMNIVIVMRKKSVRATEVDANP